MPLSDFYVDTILHSIIKRTKGETITLIETCKHIEKSSEYLSKYLGCSSSIENFLKMKFCSRFHVNSFDK